MKKNIPSDFFEGIISYGIFISVRNTLIPKKINKTKKQIFLPHSGIKFLIAVVVVGAVVVVVVIGTVVVGGAEVVVVTTKFDDD